LEVQLKGKGDVRIFYISWEGITRSTIVRGVHYVLGAASSLLLVGELEDRGVRVVVDSLGKTVTIIRD
jgi:hypothetical protein